MNPWDGYIPLRQAHRLFSWYLHCSASSALLKGMHPSRGSAKKTKIRHTNWDVTRTFENHLQLRKAHQYSHQYVGILLGQFILPPRLAKSKFSQCAMFDVQRTTNNEWPFLQEQLRWTHVIEKVRGFANIPLNYITLHCIALHYITLPYIHTYITFHYITLHCITLHCITLHYITYIRIWLYIYMFTMYCN